MAEIENSTRELRVPECPELIHLKMEELMRKQSVRKGRNVTKPEVTVMLLDKATKRVKLPKEKTL